MPTCGRVTWFLGGIMRGIWIPPCWAARSLWAPAEGLAGLMTPRPSGRGMIRPAKLENRGPQPEKRDRRTDYVGCWKWVGDRHISVQVLALKWLRELRQSR